MTAEEMTIGYTIAVWIVVMGVAIGMILYYLTRKTK